jgi:hypothetical protein
MPQLPELPRGTNTDNDNGLFLGYDSFLPTGNKNDEKITQVARSSISERVAQSSISERVHTTKEKVTRFFSNLSASFDKLKVAIKTKIASMHIFDHLDKKNVKSDEQEQTNNLQAEKIRRLAEAKMQPTKTHDDTIKNPEEKPKQENHIFPENDLNQLFDSPEGLSIQSIEKIIDYFNREGTNTSKDVEKLFAVLKNNLNEIAIFIRKIGPGLNESAATILIKNLLNESGFIISHLINQELEQFPSKDSEFTTPFILNTLLLPEKNTIISKIISEYYTNASTGDEMREQLEKIQKFIPKGKDVTPKQLELACESILSTAKTLNFPIGFQEFHKNLTDNITDNDEKKRVALKLFLTKCLYPYLEKHGEQGKAVSTRLQKMVSELKKTRLSQLDTLAESLIGTTLPGSNDRWYSIPL